MKRFWGSVLFLALAAVPLLSYAAGLVPCGGHDEPACQTCYVVQLINGVIAWLVMILGTVAAIIIVYAGFKLVTSGGNRHAKEEAKSLITNLIIGYVIVLAGWLLVDTGMKMLLIDGETRLGMWNQLSCQVQPGATTGVVTSTGSVDVNVENINPVTAPNTGAGYSNRTSCSPLPNGEYNCIPQQDSCRRSGGVPTVDRSLTPPHVECAYPAGGGGTIGGGGGAGDSGGAAGYGGTCQILTSGPCSVANLRPIFGARAEDASRICNKESGGNAIESRSDICCGPGANCAGAPSFSGGYFQINILAHANMIPGCNLSSFFTRNGSTPQGNCVRRNGNGICTGWSCSIVRNAAYNACMQGARNPNVNLRIAGQLFNSRGFQPWQNSRDLCSVRN